MKKYILAFIVNYLYLYLLGASAFFLLDLLINILGKIISNAPFHFSVRPYLGMMVAPIVYGFYGVYMRWKDPHELQSYLDAQEDKSKVQAYINEQRNK